MTVFVVVPVCAIFFILKKEADARDYLTICLFAIIELLLIVLFANGRGGSGVFMLVSAALGVVLLLMLYRKINWGILVALGVCSSVMVSFSTYFYMLPVGIAALIVLGYLSNRHGWKLQWKTGMAIILVGFIGFSVHFYVPIRSSLNPRIDENNPSRDYNTFVNFLDRRQYGQRSMIDRMFERRGAWSNQLGRHPHMGFWSYFEEQYSEGSASFAPFLFLGLIGMIVAIKKRQEIGMPFFTLFLLCTLGLILYMNFADGTKYSFETGDAYLEVRNRDYFFTPGFVFFGIAMGMGVSALMQFAKDRFGGSEISRQRVYVYASSVLVLLPAITLGNNYRINDRSDNILPYVYAKNLLDSCEQDAILFTSGDNDTFPVWCLQEVYGYRKDIRVVNLSLLNTDWYVEQMKNRYDVPISLTEEQILWHDVELSDGTVTRQPLKPFNDRPRGRVTYMQAYRWGDQVVRVQDMMVDEIVIENKWRYPIYSSAPPYSDSPLKLRDFAVHQGEVYRLDRDPVPGLVDVEKGYDLYMNVYSFDGMQNSDIFREENATGVFVGLGISAERVFNGLMAKADTARAIELEEHIIASYPEYTQTYLNLSNIYRSRGDSTRALEIVWQVHDTLTAFLETNKHNLFYQQDLGVIKTNLGSMIGDQSMMDEGLGLLWKAFEGNKNSSYAFRKLALELSTQGRLTDLQRAARMFSEYKVNMRDPLLQRLLGLSAPSSIPPAPGF